MAAGIMLTIFLTQEMDPIKLLIEFCICAHFFFQQKKTCHLNFMKF